MKKKLSLALVVAVLLTGLFAACTMPSGGTASGAPAFKTPEAAIEHFVAAIAANNYAKAMQASAYGPLAEGYNFEAMANRLKMVMPANNMAPNDGGFYTELNRTMEAGNFSRQMQMFCYSFLSDENLMMALPMEKPSDAQAFAGTIDAKKLVGLKLLAIALPGEMIETAMARQNLAAQATVYGASERTERVTLYELGGETFLGGFSLLRYGGNWYIHTLTSNFAGTPALGTVTPITTTEFQSAYG